MCAQPLDELFAGHAGPWTEQGWAGLPVSMGRVELDGALVVSPFPAVAHQRLVRNLARALEMADPVVAVVEVTTPSNAWVDRPVKPDAYARAGIPYFLRVDLDCADAGLDATSYSLATKDFVVSARTAEGRFRLDEPFPTDLDLAALAVATRYPGP